MKIVKLYEFNELKSETQKVLKDDLRPIIIEIEMQWVFDHINEEEAWNVVGCTKEYAESTPGFLHQCYYDNNKESIEAKILEKLNESLYSKSGEHIPKWDLEICA
jgi:hypothetical protein